MDFSNTHVLWACAPLGLFLSWKVIGEGKNKMESQILLFIMENTEVNEHERYRVK